MAWRMAVAERGGASVCGAAAVATAALTVSLVGCGLRSDPLLPSGTSDAGSVDPDPDRVGSCSDRIVLPNTNATVTGQLSPGRSLSQGCFEGLVQGNAGLALGGPEDAYVLVPNATTDVTISFDAFTEFEAVLLVEEDGCGGTGTTLVCNQGALDEPFHFLAEAGKEYTITIDSAEGESGAYAFDVAYGPVPLELCPVHPEDISQISGASFVWNNTLSRRQGRVDGFCGGPGSENMFTLNVEYPGLVSMTVVGSNGFSPVVSLRSGCGATSELGCAADGTTGIPNVAELEAFIEEPGQYFIVVDQTTIDGGDYDLSVFFE